MQVDSGLIVSCTTFNGTQITIKALIVAFDLRLFLLTTKRNLSSMVRLGILWLSSLAIDSNKIKTILEESVVFLSNRVKMVGNEEVTKSRTSQAPPPAPQHASHHHNVHHYLRLSINYWWNGFGALVLNSERWEVAPRPRHCTAAPLTLPGSSPSSPRGQNKQTSEYSIFYKILINIKFVTKDAQPQNKTNMIIISNSQWWQLLKSNVFDFS